jgi:maleylpyruvate isomerase
MTSPETQPGTAPETRVEPLDHLLDATQRLVRTVDSLHDDTLAEPSVLPGWSRGHVVAHVTLNAEAFIEVLRGFKEGLDIPMYPSEGARADDIEALVEGSGAELRERFLASTTVFHEAVVAVPDGSWAGEFRRLASGGQVFQRVDLPGMRHREVEIHHADLDAGYGPARWPREFLDETFDRVVRDRAGGPPLHLRTPEGDVQVGSGDGPVVTGSRVDLTWWLLGRGDGQGLHGDPHLPELGAWR